MASHAPLPQTMHVETLSPIAHAPVGPQPPAPCKHATCRASDVAVQARMLASFCASINTLKQQIEQTLTGHLPVSAASTIRARDAMAAGGAWNIATCGAWSLCAMSDNPFISTVCCMAGCAVGSLSCPVLALPVWAVYYLASEILPARTQQAFMHCSADYQGPEELNTWLKHRACQRLLSGWQTDLFPPPFRTAAQRTELFEARRSSKTTVRYEVVLRPEVAKNAATYAAHVNELATWCEQKGIFVRSCLDYLRSDANDIAIGFYYTADSDRSHGRPCLSYSDI